MGIFGLGKSKNGGVMNVIRCDEEEYLVWKWRPGDAAANTTTRENSIRYGSSLRVKDGEVAVFVYNQKDGAMQDFIVGPYDDTIKTSNFPVLANIVGIAFGGSSPFQAEIYFINLQGNNQVKFGIPYFDVVDPRLPDYPVPVAVRGTLTFALEDYRNFIKLNRLINFDLTSFKNQIKDAVVRKTKGIVANIPSDLGMPIVQMERKIEAVSELLEDRLSSRLDEFGVKMKHIDLSAIEIDKDSDAYQQVKGLTGDITAKTLQAQADLNVENMRNMQALNTENLADSMRIQREEAQRAQRLQTEQTYIGAHGLNLQAGVLHTAAENLGQMSSMQMGDNGSLNPAAMMTGMAMGGAMGSQIAGIANKMGQNLQGSIQQTPPAMPGTTGTPPSVSPQTTAQYWIAVNGQQYGPYTVNQLGSMVNTGQFTRTSLVWTQGLAQWAAAATIPELLVILEPATPPIPDANGMVPPPIP